MTLQVEGTLLAYNAITSPADAAFHYPIIPPLPWYGGGQDWQESGAPEYQVSRTLCNIRDSPL